MPRMSTGGAQSPSYAPSSPSYSPQDMDTSTLPPHSVSSATSTLRLPPPLPPTSLPPVETLKKHATLRSSPPPLSATKTLRSDELESELMMMLIW